MKTEHKNITSTSVSTDLETGICLLPAVLAFSLERRAGA